MEGNMKDNASEKVLEIVASEDIMRGRFSNEVIISHSAEEFHLDFIYINPSGRTLSSRIIMTPTHYKRFLRAMGENLNKYEIKFGVINEVKRESENN
jgi:hypothetical protein